MPTVGGCTNLPESESRFRRSASVAVPPPFTEVACYQIFTLAAGGELSLPEAGTVGLGEAFLRLARGGLRFLLYHGIFFENGHGMSGQKRKKPG